DVVIQRRNLRKAALAAERDRTVILSYVAPRQYQLASPRAAARRDPCAGGKLGARKLSDRRGQAQGTRVGLGRTGVAKGNANQGRTGGGDLLEQPRVDDRRRRAVADVGDAAVVGEQIRSGGLIVQFGLVVHAEIAGPLLGDRALVDKD